MTEPVVKFKPLMKDPPELPQYQTPGAAGADIRASHGVFISPNSQSIVGTGYNVEVPVGYELQVRSRSGLAAKNSVMVLNSPGTIDSDYRGEIKVILFNHGSTSFRVNKGDRIAQLVLSPVTRAQFEVTHRLSDSDRSVNGFGSTGVE